ncbi:MAG TPA: zinc-dependent alcohol dehydrogenase family protein [Ktedonobacteraceae bacterium]|jgi:2-desacetyl-2-hydroxyethyl bacteriochlorophyllide A dehydrogenase|nr:zinc-dependent alcohol dehydrogenase family protein [Ktedonobacteraceae bacterium]
MSTSVVWKQPGAFTLEERELAKPGPGQLKVRVEASGLCGTDLHIAAGEEPRAELDVVIGHEFTGTVVEVGEGAEQYRSGDRVVVDPNIPCHTCYYCRSARPHLCIRPQALGVTRDGGMAQYALLPAEQAYLIPQDLAAPAAALTEPLACALHAVDQAGLRTGQTALVLGGGPMGVLCSILLIAGGAARVIVSEQQVARRGRLNTFGVESVAPEDVPLEEADVVMECVGRPETMQQAITAARPGGTVVWVGVAHPAAVVPVKPYDVYRRELTIRSTYTNPFTMERSIAMLCSGRIDWEDIVTHRFSLEQFDEAWEAHKQGVGLKVCVEP